MKLTRSRELTDFQSRRTRLIRLLSKMVRSGGVAPPRPIGRQSLELLRLLFRHERRRTNGAGGENRTPVLSLENSGPTTKRHPRKTTPRCCACDGRGVLGMLDGAGRRLCSAVYGVAHRRTAIVRYPRLVSKLREQASNLYPPHSECGAPPA